MKYAHYFTDLTHTGVGDNKTLDYIKKRIDLYGKDNHQIGKMLQRTNLEVMSRKVYKLNL